MSSSVSYLTPAQLQAALAIRDLSDQAAGPHAIQVLVDRAVEALSRAWSCEVRWCRGPDVVPVADNYDRLGYAAGAITRETRYTRYVGAGRMLRSHSTAMVPPALRQLRKNGWRLAILSNTDPDLLAASLEQIGVAVDVRITATEAGSYKPAHGHWRRFFETTGADARHHVHVGASAFHDLAPANELGLTAVWINRLAEVSEIPRAAELTDLSGLPVTLERLVNAD